MVIWIGPSYGAPRDVRIEVMMAHGQQMDPNDLAVVALRPKPHIVVGRLSSADLRAVTDWLAINEEAVFDHWNAVIDGAELVQRLRRLP
jgi:hypothetical protein